MHFSDNYDTKNCIFPQVNHQKAGEEEKEEEKEQAGKTPENNLLI